MRWVPRWPILPAAAVLVVAGVVSWPARAGDLLDRVKRDGILHCAATERPGYAEIDDGVPAGRAADLCRTVAEAVLGKQGRFALRLLDLDGDFDRVRAGGVELVFLESRVVIEQGLAPHLVSVGEAYRDQFVVMLPTSVPGRRLEDLHGQTICFMIADPVWPLLQSRLGGLGVEFRPFGFSEEVEMKDAYNVGRCGAMAGTASKLDELRTDAGVNHLHSRFVDQELGPDPVAAMVPPGDPEWASLVRSRTQGADAR